MAKELRRSIEHWLDDEWVERTIEMAELRRLIKEHVEDSKRTRKYIKGNDTFTLSRPKIKETAV